MSGAAPLEIAVVTGTRAEFGLLAPVMRAVERRPALRLRVVVAGAHFLPPALTHREVEEAFEVAARVPMQDPAARPSRDADALALGRGVSGFAGVFASMRPAWVVVLGDRIEAFAAAAAASVGGHGVAHLHGGDRAEGVADEAMRGAITKLAHLHLAATEESAGRIVRMGEDAGLVHVVGSPAVDGVAGIAPMADAEAVALGDPGTVLLMHPAGLDEGEEVAWARAAIEAAAGVQPDGRVLWLAPNHDPGREAVMGCVRSACAERGWRAVEHLPRERFVALLKRLAAGTGGERGAIVGNSSAGLIDAAILGLPAVNLGPRQGGRERAGNVVDIDRLDDGAAVREAARFVAGFDRGRVSHPYGDGRTGERVAGLLALGRAVVRKRNVY